MQTEIDIIQKRLAKRQHPISTAIVTAVEPESSTIGKMEKKKSQNMIKQTIEEAEVEALKL